MIHLLKYLLLLIAFNVLWAGRVHAQLSGRWQQQQKDFKENQELCFDYHKDSPFFGLSQKFSAGYRPRVRLYRLDEECFERGLIEENSLVVKSVKAVYVKWIGFFLARRLIAASRLSWLNANIL